VLDTDKFSNVYESATFTAGSSVPASLAVIRRRLAPDGQFDGSIGAVLAPSVLHRLFAEATPIAHSALLITADGTILARDPSRTDGRRRIAADEPLMRHRSGKWHLSSDPRRRC
jgi:hypothetical protein